MHLTNFHFYPYKNHLYSKPVKGLRGYEVGYGFSFNGKEKDNETYGEGNTYDFGARIYDARIGRWMSVDMLTKSFTSYSPYNFAGNTPILFMDIDGNIFINPYSNEREKRRLMTNIKNAKEIFEDFVKNNPELINREYKNLKKNYEYQQNQLNELEHKEELVNNVLYTLEKIDQTTFDRFNTLKNSDGTDVVIPIYLSDDLMASNGASANTLVRFEYDSKTNTKNLGPCIITLFQKQGVGSLGNEIGDIKYCLDEINTQKEFEAWQDPSVEYTKRPETDYSFKFETKIDKAYDSFKKINNIENNKLDERGSLVKPKP